MLQADDQRADLHGRRDRAGLRGSACPLMDMEMVQYHPTTLAENGFLITEGARGEGAHLLNAEGRRFMEDYAPNKMELASRDVVSRAEQTEINEGRGVGPDGQGIYLDITVVPKKRVLEALREIVNIGRDFAGTDITREPIMIRPGQHYIMGGVKTDVERLHADHGPLRGRRGRVRVGPRRQPARRELAARHADLRPALGRARRRARSRHADAVGARVAPGGGRRADPVHHRPRARRPADLGDQGRARHDDEREGRGLPRRGGPAPRRSRRSAASRRRPTSRRSTTAGRSSTRTCSARSSSATC